MPKKIGIIDSLKILLGITKVGCPYCIVLYKKDVAFRRVAELYKHLEEVHNIFVVDGKRVKREDLEICPNCNNYKRLNKDCICKNFEGLQSLLND